MPGKPAAARGKRFSPAELEAARRVRLADVIADDLVVLFCGAGDGRPLVGWRRPRVPLVASTPRRVNHQDRVMTGHLPGGEARFVAEGSHGHEGCARQYSKIRAPVNPARFTYMSKEESGDVPNGITTCGRK
jgi:hypothetical protein